ncbi:MAG TPA: DUF3828 domain-containing protein [Pyrinomonadaceae bacterium]|jgi:hypothetical protein
MKYKSFGLSLLLALCLFGNAFGQAAAAESPEQTAKEFYRWYLQELNRDRYPIQQQKTELLKKVSRRLGRWLYSPAYEEYGADYFLSAQDWDKNWAKGITTSKALIKGNSAALKLTLAAPRGTASASGFGKHTLAIKLVKENGLWKIDRVDNN